MCITYLRIFDNTYVYIFLLTAGLNVLGFSKGEDLRKCLFLLYIILLIRKGIKMELKKIDKILKILSIEYPDAETELNFTSPFELLIATILSAQTTDKQVNKVTSILFTKYNSAADYANISEEVLEKEINSIGLYRNKSKYIIKTSKIIMNEFAGDVPDNRKDLLKLPGVGRKTANVILSCAFNKNTIAVDTHVFRVANRLSLANSNKVDQVERQLMEKVPEDKWSDLHHWLIFHGRRVCKAQNPDCQNCTLSKLCAYYQNRNL